MMKTMKKIIFFLFLVLFGTEFAQAQKAGVVYVDIQYILKALPQYETANEQLTMISRRWQREVDALEHEAQVMQTNYQTEQIFLTDDMRAAREKEIADKQLEALALKRRYFGADGELYKKREALLKPIQDEIYAAIAEIAADKKYEIVKDRSADPSLIYIAARLDISDLVLRKLGAK